MFSSQPSLTIIGFGAFGRLLARYLAPHARVSVHDCSPEARRAATSLGHTVVANLSGIEADIVILAVPLPALASCLNRLAPHLRAGQLVIDTCSIKEEPARLLRDTLPPAVEILATHPMFGPRSAASTLAGAQIVLCPIRGHGWRRLAAFLRHSLQLRVVLSTAEEHDRQAAVTQGLTHLIARALASLGDQPRIRTRSFEMMTEALAMVADDAPEIFEAVTRHNRHVLPQCERFLGALRDLSGTSPASARDRRPPR